MKPTLQFLGAAQNVTGSRYLLEVDGFRLLVDCGLYQERDYRQRNWEPFPVPPDTVDAVLLTHAHLDHCGYLPRFVRGGFQGRIHGTDATLDIARIVLLDSGRIQEEDARYKKMRHRREGRKGPHEEAPLYTEEDAEAVFPLFSSAAYSSPLEIGPGIGASFHEAGHILGSTMIRLELAVGGGTRAIVFSGDIGRWRMPILKDPTLFQRADYVVMESTYGDRLHEDPGDVDDMLEDIITETHRRGGNIVIPSFAIGRTQDLLYQLNGLLIEDRIPHLMVFVDSPMANRVTEVFKKHPDLYDREMGELVDQDMSPFSLPNLKATNSVAESKAINHLKGTAVIIAGSGMCTGGRIKHHLVHNIDRAESTVLFVGYQAVGTLGREIVEGADEVRILGARRAVRARIAQINGFSAHADRGELERWASSLVRPPRRAFITHGEPDAAHSLADLLSEQHGFSTLVPEYGEEAVLE